MQQRTIMTKTRGAGAAPMRQRALGPGGGGFGQNKLRMLFPSLYLTFIIGLLFLIARDSAILRSMTFLEENIILNELTSRSGAGTGLFWWSKK